MTDGYSAALHLQGRILDGGWVVDDQVPLLEGHTGSAFSVGYWVHDGKGRRGFLKAFDFAKAFRQPDMTTEVERLTTLYNGERDLLRWCNEKGLSRIVRSLDDGVVQVLDFQLSAVPYVIFEAADQDVRRTLAECDPADQIARLRLAHHAAVAVRQLHGNSVSHRDIKPSNMVVWARTTRSKSSRPHYEGKMSDLGCAHIPGRPSPHDDDPIAGDSFYASPEQLYRCPERLSDRRHRQAADMFMLGNLIVYLMTGVTFNELLYKELDDTQHWSNWDAGYDDVLPGLVDAHGRALARFEVHLLADLQPLREVIDHLCHPDPIQRGDAIARRRQHNPFNLERFVTRLNLIGERAAASARAS